MTVPLSTVDQVCLELSEMRKLDIAVPAGAEDYVRSNEAEIEAYRVSMKIHEITDLVIDLLQLNAGAGAPEAAPRPRYVTCSGWTHIFTEGGREKERYTRWVYDRETDDLVALDIIRNQKWRDASAAERVDVLDSLKNGNAGCLDAPAEWEFAELNDLPPWS